MDYIITLRNFLWGRPLIFLILACGLYYTIKLRFIQSEIKKSFAAIKRRGNNKGLSVFQSVCLTLSSSIGTGNIVGVATSITLGGVGALFWMAISAFLGMAIKYAEAIVAVKYRVKSKGSTIGGPFYYITEAFKGRKCFSYIFAFAGVMSALWGIGASIQAKSFVLAIDNIIKNQSKIVLISGNSMGVISFILLLIICAIAGMVLSGGINRIGKVTSILMPIFAGAYILFTSVIIIVNIDKFPSAVYSILKSAFGISALGGGVAGYSIMLAMQNGMARGIFSNEAGLGSSCMALAAVDEITAKEAGYSNMLGPFLDTLCICMLTGLCIVITGANTSGLDGIELSALAFEKGLNLPFGIGNTVVSLCLALFSFTTIIGWNYYGEACVRYLFGDKAINKYKCLYLISAILSPLISAQILWLLADIFNALMAIPNITALIILNKVIMDEHKKRAH